MPKQLKQNQFYHPVIHTALKRTNTASNHSVSKGTCVSISTSLMVFLESVFSKLVLSEEGHVAAAVASMSWARETNGIGIVNACMAVTVTSA